jgi:hypothetical protein
MNHDIMTHDNERAKRGESWGEAKGVERVQNSCQHLSIMIISMILDDKVRGTYGFPAMVAAHINDVGRWSY